MIIVWAMAKAIPIPMMPRTALKEAPNPYGRKVMSKIGEAMILENISFPERRSHNC